MTDKKWTWKKFDGGYFHEWGSSDQYETWVIRRGANQAGYPTWNVEYIDTFPVPRIQHRIALTFWTLREAKAFCEWLDKGYTREYLNRRTTNIPTFSSLGEEWKPVEPVSADSTKDVPTNT